MPTDKNTNPSPLAATAQDAADILDLRNRLSDWMHNRGISQWHRSDVSEERIRHQAAAGQWWLIRSDAGDLIAAIRTLNEDPQIGAHPTETRSTYMGSWSTGATPVTVSAADCSPGQPNTDAAKPP